MPSNIILVNNAEEFIVPDSRMPALIAYLNHHPSEPSPSLRQRADEFSYITAAAIKEGGHLSDFEVEKVAGVISPLFLDFATGMGAQGSGPEIVCLCGSTRFMDTFHAANRKLSLAGKIVLTVEIQTYDGATDPQGTDVEVKEMLDGLHLRKIDLSDWVLVLNVDGYIGESTRAEIDYAESIGKPIKYLEAIDQPAQQDGEVEDKCPNNPTNKEPICSVCHRGLCKWCRSFTTPELCPDCLKKAPGAAKDTVVEDVVQAVFEGPCDMQHKGFSEADVKGTIRSALAPLVDDSKFWQVAYKDMKGMRDFFHRRLTKEQDAKAAVIQQAQGWAMEARIQKAIAYDLTIRNKELEKVITDSEWVRDGYDCNRCPFCMEEESDGHNDDCIVHSIPKGGKQ